MGTRLSFPKRLYANVLDLGFFALLAWFLWGGYWRTDADGTESLKGAFIRDGQLGIALLYLIGRMGFGVRFRDTVFGNTLYSIFLPSSTEKPTPGSKGALQGMGVWRKKFLQAGFQILLLILCSLFFATPLLQYRTYGNYIFDLGIFDQVIWSGANLGSLSTTFLNFDGVHRFQYFPFNHLNFGLWIFSAIYRFFPYTELLLLLQSVVLAGSLLPLLLISRTLFPSLKEAPLFTLVLFLAWEPFFRMNTWDFHETPFSCFLILWGFYFYLCKPSTTFYSLVSLFFFAFSSIWRSDLWITFSMVVLLLFLPRARTIARRTEANQKGIRTKSKVPWIFRPGYLWILAAVTFVAFPLHSAFFNQVNTLAERYPYLGENFSSLGHRFQEQFFLTTWSVLSGIGTALISNRHFFLRILLNTGFFCLFAPRYFLIVLPAILEIGLSTREGTATFVSHYTGLFSGPILVATLMGWKQWMDSARQLGTLPSKVSQWWSPATCIALSLAVAFSQNGYHLIGTFKRAVHRFPEARCLDSLLTLVPPDAAVLAHDPVAARLAKREWITSPSTASTDQFRDYSRAEWLILPYRTPSETEQSDLELGFLQKESNGINTSIEWELRQEGCGHRIYSKKDSLAR